MLFLPTVISFILNLEICNSLTHICKSDLTANMILAMVHSSIISVATLYHFYAQNFDYYNWLKIYSIGFLMADGTYFYIYRKLNHRYIYLLHHFLFCISWVWFDHLDLILFNQLLLSEITTPFLNLKILCKKKHFPKLELASGFITYILFSIFRVVNFSYVSILSYYRGVFVIYPILIPLTSMQYYWFYLMSKKIKSTILSR